MRKSTNQIIVGAYVALKDIKINALENKDKFALLKIFREFRPIAEKYNKDIEEAQIKLKPDNFEQMQEKAKQWEKDKTSLSSEEVMDINKYFREYGESIDKYVSSLNEEEVDIQSEPLSEEALNKLLEIATDLTLVGMLNIEDALGSVK